MNCIFCNVENEAKSVEHIVPESFGNKNYVLRRGDVCDECNTKFSKFEGPALTASVFAMERARFGIATKKGKSAKGKVNDLSIEGDIDFKAGYITATGLTDKSFIDFNPLTQVGHVLVASFDKSEVATSKLILKIGIESLYESQRKVYRKYDFTELKDFLAAKNTTDWPFITNDYEIDKFSSVPRYTDKYLLKQIRCELKYFEYTAETLLFIFKYGAIPITINLLNRNLEWIVETENKFGKISLYPQHFKAKLTKMK